MKLKVEQAGRFSTRNEKRYVKRRKSRAWRRFSKRMIKNGTYDLVPHIELSKYHGWAD